MLSIFKKKKKKSVENQKVGQVLMCIHVSIEAIHYLLQCKPF